MASDVGATPPPLPHLRSPTETEATSAVASAKLGQKKSLLASLFARNHHHHKRRRDTEEESQRSLQSAPPGEAPVPLDHNIDLSSDSPGFVARSVQSEPVLSGDQYVWATVYEHQRGATLLSTPYYSSQSLFPWDPPPFMVKKGHDSDAIHTMQTLADYVLPDPSWRWVSRAWMVDMRSDGAVQYDGFEYNWHFRNSKWRPRVGVLSAGGWVRRRRWVRLMVRLADESALPSDSKPSIISSALGDSVSEIDIDEIWHGNEDDWRRVAVCLKKHPRDGSKLELWRSWLGVRVPQDRRRQWTEDPDHLSPFKDDVEDSGPPVHREWLVSVLEEHGRDLLHHFIFPDSRAQFLDLLFRADLRDRLSNSGIFDGFDFYSRSPTLGTIATSASMPSTSSARLAAALDTTEYDSSTTVPDDGEATGYEVHVVEKERAADTLDSIEVGHESDGSKVTLLDKGKRRAD